MTGVSNRRRDRHRSLRIRDECRAGRERHVIAGDTGKGSPAGLQSAGRRQGRQGAAAAIPDSEDVLLREPEQQYDAMPWRPVCHAGREAACEGRIGGGLRPPARRPAAAALPERFLPYFP
jgi:hypothetical protein